jgi:mono/diheme cytochrome c family protein
MKGNVFFIVALATLAVPALAQQGDAARGRYIALIGGCNDCHTAGFPQKGGEVPEAEWLLGNPVGFRGPWGTTYPTNLRLTQAPKK